MSSGTIAESTGVMCHPAVDSCGVAPPSSPSPCLAIVLHPLRPARVSQAMCLLAELGLIEAHSFPARRRKRARLPRNPFAISEELLLHIASFVGDAVTLRALSATNKQIDAVLCRSPAGALIWNRLLLVHFSLDARSLMRSTARQREPAAAAELRRAGASIPAAGGSSGAAPSSSRSSSSRATHRSSSSLGTVGVGSGAGAGDTPVDAADESTAASAGDAAHASAAPAAPALPPCCVPKLLYESLERTRRDVSRAAQATAEAQRLQRLGRVDASMWHGLMDATGLARFASEPARPAAPRWGANGWFNFGGASWYGSSA
jgi:hypothetical protein